MTDKLNAAKWLCDCTEYDVVGWDLHCGCNKYLGTVVKNPNVGDVVSYGDTLNQSAEGFSRSFIFCCVEADVLDVSEAYTNHVQGAYLINTRPNPDLDED